jgi:hypothetical protein
VPIAAQRTSVGKAPARIGRTICTAVQTAMAASAAIGMSVRGPASARAVRVRRRGRAASSNNPWNQRASRSGQSGAKKIVVAAMVSHGKMPILKKAEFEAWKAQ